MSIEVEVKEGQVTLEPEVIRHLGLNPGDKLLVELLPSGRIEARVKARPTIASIVGMLKRPGQPVLTIDEINEAAAEGWAGIR
jgi:hypothetical protein